MGVELETGSRSRYRSMSGTVTVLENLALSAEGGKCLCPPELFYTTFGDDR
jgi:hypothetical protein